MVNEIRLHGRANDSVEYYASIAGPDLVHRYCYEFSDTEGDRFFYGGKEFVIGPEGITHNGNGGSFCKYMFGAEQPLRDLVRKNVLNRLAMYGAQFNQDTGRVTFTDKTNGSLNFKSIFMDGNAISNYYFFIDVNMPGDNSEVQESLTKFIGKTLKYSSAVGAGDDTSLLSELIADLDGYNPVIFLFRLVHRYQKRYYDLFTELYEEEKVFTDDGERLLTSLAKEFKIDQYQQERIKLDVIYSNEDNKRIIDEYKDLLISYEDQEEISSADKGALNRVRSLAVHNKIPPYLFDLLDEVLLKGKTLAHGEDPDYIKSSRALLDSLFTVEGALDKVLSKDDIESLIGAKKMSLENKDQAFESLLLETGKDADERFEKGDAMAFEKFSELITYFDRYDNTSSIINKMAFMDDEVTIEKLRSIVGNRRIFEDISKGLFETLFIAELLTNKYIPSSGKKKIMEMKKGLEEVENGYKSLNDIVLEVARVNNEERLYSKFLKIARDRLTDMYNVSKGVNDDFLKEIVKGIFKKNRKVPRAIFDRIFMALKMEVFYINDILPKIIDTQDIKNREDFLKNSGFDRFHIEEIERDAMEKLDLPNDKVDIFRGIIAQA